jgi:hypothetical protein
LVKSIEVLLELSFETSKEVLPVKRPRISNSPLLVLRSDPEAPVSVRTSPSLEAVEDISEIGAYPPILHQISSKCQGIQQKGMPAERHFFC